MGLLSTAVTAIATNAAAPAVAVPYQYCGCTNSSTPSQFQPLSSCGYSLKLSLQQELLSSRSVCFGNFCTQLRWCSCGSITNIGATKFRVSHRKWRRRWSLLVMMVDGSKAEPIGDSQGILKHSLRRLASWVGEGDDLPRRLIEQRFWVAQGPKESNQESLVDTEKAPSSELGTSGFGSYRRTGSTTAQKQTPEISESVSGSPETEYTTTVDSALATPPLYSVGDGLVGVGSIVFLTIALVGWWRELGNSSKSSVSSETTTTQVTEELREAQAAVAAPIALSLLLQRDVKKKESAEWLNMVLGKIWNLYRRTLEGRFIELLQPLIDEIPEKPPLVQRVKIVQFFLGDDPVTVRSIERRTSRRANDLQYHIGLRYSGNSRIVLSVTLKVGFLPITVPFGIRGLDLDGEMWVKLRLIPTEPWVGTATWAFVSLPKITLALAPFRIFNLMAVPVLNIFLTKLLTQDLPLLFVRPNKSVVNFLQGKAVGPLSRDFKDGIVLNGFAGELSVTLIEARDLTYFPVGKTDPYVVLLLGEQVIRSKKNSKTSILGPPGAPVWNQDLKLLVVDPKVQRLRLRVRDAVGFTTITVGSIEVPLDDLQDTIPVDRVLSLQSGWGPFPKRNSGKLLLRLTYKAYVEDEEEIGIGDRPLTNKLWDEIGNFISNEIREGEFNSMEQPSSSGKTTSVDAESSDKGFRLTNPLITQTFRKSSSNGNVRVNSGNENPSNPTVKGASMVENPALQDQQKKERSWGMQIQTVAKSSTIMWLAVITGITQTSVHMSQRVRVTLAIDADALAKSAPPLTGATSLTSGYHQFDFFDSGTSSIQLQITKHGAENKLPTPILSKFALREIWSSKSPYQHLQQRYLQSSLLAIDGENTKQSGLPRELPKSVQQKFSTDIL